MKLINFNQIRCGVAGLLVSVLAFYYDDPSLTFTEVKSFFCKVASKVDAFLKIWFTDCGSK